MKKIAIICAVIMLCACSCKTNEKKAGVKTVTLKETHWTLTHIQEQTIAEGPDEAFIVFNTDGKISGNLGCNSFFGSYSDNKDKLNIEFAGSTKRLCGDMQTEDNFQRAVKSDITSYTIDGKVLILKSQGKEVLRFEAR